MFRKLVSNLPFSPALVGQLGFYARRMRKEEATRRLGLIMTVLALIVQSLVVFIPPTSANTSHPSDLVPGGVDSMSELLSYYDNSKNDYKKILSYAGITRDEIKNMKKTSINSRDKGTSSGAWLSWGRVSRMSAAKGEVKHNIDGTIVYSRPLWRLDTTEWTKVHGSTYTAFVGKSAKMGTFAIIMNCGNLVTTKLPPAPRKITVCRPGTGIITILESEKKSTDLPADSSECLPKNAVCSDIVTVKIDRTHYNFKASASAENATIKGYVFTIRKDSSSGAVVTTKTVNTSATQVESGSIELSSVGNYYVSVTVNTSLGEKTSPNCAEAFSVSPPDKCEVNPSLTKNDPACKPCPGNPQLWINSPECTEVVIESKTAKNLTQGIADATTTNAVAGDRIEYRLTVSNPGKVTARASFTEELDDVLEYATIQDTGGGAYDINAKTLIWPAVNLAPGEKQTRTFVIALLAEIPTTARGSSEPTSYDCVMNNTFGDNVQVKVTCETPKIVEQTVSELPKTGPRENILYGTALLTVVVFFWARSRQLGKEVRLIRKDFGAGTI